MWFLKIPLISNVPQYHGQKVNGRGGTDLGHKWCVKISPLELCEDCKTQRWQMGGCRLNPPGDVFCLAFAVFTHRAFKI